MLKLHLFFQPAEKKPRLQPNEEVVVESGPVEYAPEGNFSRIITACSCAYRVFTEHF